MTVVSLGKAVKAMYKLSGKTLNQLSEETDLSIDTINNFFYARLQKPSFLGVSKLVEATGYSMNDLIGFLEASESFPANADYCDEFAKYMLSVELTTPSVKPARGTSVESATPSVDSTIDKYVEELNANHHEQVEQLINQFKEQIQQMENSFTRLKEHYDHSVGEIKKTQAAELTRIEKECKYAHRTTIILSITLLASVLVEFLIKL